MNVVQELNGATPTANLLASLGIDETLLRTDAAGARSFLADGLGSTLALTDSAGLVQSEYTYEPFGKTSASGITSTNAFKYTGREDDGTGLYYYRARYYHPGLQRFVAEDPIGFRGKQTNLYAYVGNSPVRYVDPSGLMKLPDSPRGLGPEWKPDPTHRDPNGQRFRDPSGRPLDWHPGQPGKPGWGGRDHCHDPENAMDNPKRPTHLPPGTEIPDPAPLPPGDPEGGGNPPDSCISLPPPSPWWFLVPFFLP